MVGGEPKFMLQRYLRDLTCIRFIFRRIESRSNGFHVEESSIRYINTKNSIDEFQKFLET